MRSSKSGKKKFVIQILVFIGVVLLFLKGYLKETEIQKRDNRLKTYPILEALNKLDPQEFEVLYKQGFSSDITTSDVMLSTKVWIKNNLGRLLNSAPDEAVNEFSKYNANLFDTFLNLDPTGVFCFNMLYPGVQGSPDINKLKELTNELVFKRTYLNSIADSINQKVKIDRLPVEQIEKVISSIHETLAEKYGDDYYIEDPQELAKQPALECKTRRDFYDQVMKLDPHLSAEVIRYLNPPK
ncbi:hypothetical protein Xmau_02901 [Xenorhabdus mauleonii]|uniref:Uncharacterized protein n=1 Tax=Xenorhabdus mauleonii TaxID=351675 RepID=A0A1I3WML0_9GAMM|nr:hypothetical protein [Xenorhabdus mauleonii]PHM39297.1 hypothetical protein Xmau_02901 [Xenorhabdus mauleonii]SFK08580.1 hypothetical protein SAMN05421680_12812 [Xenorhabdus mauleonii]